MKRVQNFICFISNKLGSPFLQNGTTETWQSNLLIIEAYFLCMNITLSNFRIRSDNAMILVQKVLLQNSMFFQLALFIYSEMLLLLTSIIDLLNIP